MSDHLVLTFAEIEFLLRVREPQDVDVRAELRLAGDGRNAAAGLASLLARGLCSHDGERVVPADDLVGVIGALSTATTATKALGWRDGQPVLLSLFTGPVVGLVLQPIGLGRYAVAALDPGRGLGDQLAGFIDSCLAGGNESAVLVRSGDTRIAVVTTAAGEWYVSDSLADPGTSRKSTRDGAVARVRELMAVPA
ncbi:hypothetical protein [Actinophytocola sp. KF-1]